MNYRINGDYQTPFRIYPSIIDVSPYKIHFSLRVKATCPQDKVASQVTIKFNLPKDTAACTFEIPQGI